MPENTTILDRAAMATNPEFAAMAAQMSLPLWLRACKQRLARERRGAPLWTTAEGPGSEEHFEALATAAYRDNCAHADRREADQTARSMWGLWRPHIDTSRLYQPGDHL